MWLPALLLTACSAAPVAVAADPPPAEGTWEYRQPNPAAPGGVDPEGDRLVLARDGARWSGTWLGLEREGEHGLFYSATAVEQLVVSPDGSVAFVVPARRLCTTRPRSPADVARLRCGSFSTDALTFRGTVEGDRLVLACTSSWGSCPDATMAFRRGRWR